MDSLTALDAQGTAAINSISGVHPWLDALMIGVTHVGVPLLVLAVISTWWVGGGSRPERHAAIVCGLSFLIGLGLNQIILMSVHRVRPYDAGVTHLLIAPSADPSFPSDHATAVAAIVFGYLFLARFRRATCFLIGAAAVILSRVYIGTHYISDVAGGVATAFAAVLLVRVAYKQGSRLDTIVTGIF